MYQSFEHIPCLCRLSDLHDLAIYRGFQNVKLRCHRYRKVGFLLERVFLSKDLNYRSIYNANNLIKPYLLVCK